MLDEVTSDGVKTETRQEEGRTGRNFLPSHVRQWVSVAWGCATIFHEQKREEIERKGRKDLSFVVEETGGKSGDKMIEV